jgi:4-diphosphocytidyl-2-C-methyl-D-erythritol kinase
MINGAVRQFAHAKVNLWLNIVGRRAKDGYHLIDSLVAFADVADLVDGANADGLSLTLDGPFAAALAAEPGNLVLKAARSLAARANVASNAKLHLTKNIPVASGLGGGSADAAATLRLLIELWRLDVAAAELQELAIGLGADVPMCLAGKTALVSGVGEGVRPAPALPPCAILLVNSGAALSTAEVFAARRGDFSRSRPIERPWSDLSGLVAALNARGNDLAVPAISLRPEIAEVLAFLRGSEGARYAAMSGSGGTCFALYDTLLAAQRAAAFAPAGWWRHAGRLVSN